MEHLRRWLPNYPQNQRGMSITWIRREEERDVDFSRGWLTKNLRYDMIIGQELLLELKLYLCFSDCVIKGNGGAYEGCNTPIK